MSILIHRFYAISRIFFSCVLDNNGFVNCMGDGQYIVQAHETSIGNSNPSNNTIAKCKIAPFLEQKRADRVYFHCKRIGSYRLRVSKKKEREEDQLNKQTIIRQYLGNHFIVFERSRLQIQCVFTTVQRRFISTQFAKMLEFPSHQFIHNFDSPYTCFQRENVSVQNQAFVHSMLLYSRTSVQSFILLC